MLVRYRTACSQANLGWEGDREPGKKGGQEVLVVGLAMIVVSVMLLLPLLMVLAVVVALFICGGGTAAVAL